MTLTRTKKMMSKRSRRNHKKVSLLAAALIAVLLLIACTGQSTPQQVDLPTAEPEPTPTPSLRGIGDTLHLLYPQAPTILNPHLTATEKDWEASRISYEPLASFDGEGNLVEFLAAEIPTLENGGLAEDGRSVTWKLKQDVKWSDGETFTADDVLFTYDYITNPDVKSTSASIYSDVDSVELIDAYTVKVNFNKSNPAWAGPFVGIQGVILPRHVFEEYNGANASQAPANTMPVGTGPYQALSPGIKTQEVIFIGTDLIETSKIVYEPNPFFREEDKPYFSRVELRGGVTEKEAIRLVLQTGDVDFAWNLQLTPETQAEFNQATRGQVIANLGPDVERILLNSTDPNQTTAQGEFSSLEIPHPFFSDLKVRQALTYAIDRETISALYGETGRPTSNILVSPANFRSPNTIYEYNLDKAAALLDEAGWVDSDSDGIRDKDGVEMAIVFQTSVNSIRQQTQQIVQRSLRSIGVRVEPKITDSTIFFNTNPSNRDTRSRFSADIMEYFTGSDSPDPSVLMGRWVCAEIPQMSNNWTGLNHERWCNPQYDELFRQASAEVDSDIREQLFIQMNDMLINDVVTIPLVHRGQVSGVSNTLQEVNPTPWDAETWNIKEWRRSTS
jgi:peptide/nickel transport system substrate-binding protein